MEGVHVRRVTARRIAVVLTVWFAAVNLLVLIRPQVSDRLFFIMIPMIYSYFLLPVRWAAAVLLQIQRIRAKPIRWLPHAPALQIPAAVLVHAALAMMSVAGWWALWDDNSRIGDRAGGFFFHVVVPSIIVARLVRRTPPVPTASSLAS
jgi:hypothetical protein